MIKFFECNYNVNSKNFTPNFTNTLIGLYCLGFKDFSFVFFKVVPNDDWNSRNMI